MGRIQIGEVAAFIGSEGCRETRAGKITVGYVERTSLLAVSLAVLYVLDDVTTGVAGEYTTDCCDTLASRTIDSSSSTSQKDISGRGQSAVDRSGDGYGMVDAMCISSGSMASPHLVTLVTVKLSHSTVNFAERCYLSCPWNDPSGATRLRYVTRFVGDGTTHGRLCGAYLSLRRRL